MKKRRRLLSVIIAIAMLVTMIPVGLFASANATISITDYTQLSKIGNDAAFPLNGDYVLAGDITAPADSNWIPIGTEKDAFTGTFNGQGFSIKQLKITGTIPVPAGSPSGTEPTLLADVGLFGYIKGSTASVSNLTLIDSSIVNVGSQSNSVGFFAGVNEGTITNCASARNKVKAIGVKGNKAYGGIAGENFGTISKCYNSSNITILRSTQEDAVSQRVPTLPKVGGIAGYNHAVKSTGETYTYGTISNCFNIGTMAVKVSNSYLSSSCGIGGIIGSNEGVISKTYNAGMLSGQIVGGIVGFQFTIAGSTVSDSYYLDKTAKTYAGNKDTDPSGTTKMIQADMKLANMTGLAAADWTDPAADAAYPFPTITGLAFFDTEVNNTLFNGGNGRLYSPYLINNTSHLNNVRTDLSAAYTLTDDILFMDWEYSDNTTNTNEMAGITLGGTASTLEGQFFNGGDKWRPIGVEEFTQGTQTYTTVEQFTGVFTGGPSGKTIYNLQVNATGTDPQLAGLFAINDGIISNISILDAPTVPATRDALINKNTYVSTAANSNPTELANIEAAVKARLVAAPKINGASISAKSADWEAHAGSICAINNKLGTINSVKSVAIVTAQANAIPSTLYPKTEAFAGGITAKNLGSINDARNEGTVSATSETLNSISGGIVGKNQGKISSSVNTGSVTAGYITANISSEINTYLRNVYLAAGGIAGDSLKIEKNDGSELKVISDSKNIGGVRTQLTSTSINDNIFAGGIVGNGQDPLGSGCYYWNESAKFAIENQKYKDGSTLLSKPITDPLLISGLVTDTNDVLNTANYKTDTFISITLPTPPAEGYNPTNYDTHIKTNLSAKVLNNKGTVTSIQPADVSTQCTAVPSSKYIDIKSNVAEPSNPGKIVGTSEYVILLKPDNITVDATYAQTVYCKGDDFDPDGLVVTAAYADNTTQRLNYGQGDFEYSLNNSYNQNTVGAQQITIKYNGAADMKVVNAYSVTVYDPTLEFTADRVNYPIGYTFTSNDFVAELVYGPADNQERRTLQFKSSDAVDGYTVTPKFSDINTAVASTTPIEITASYKVGTSGKVSVNILPIPSEVTTKDPTNQVDGSDPGNKKLKVPLGTSVSQLKANLNGNEFIEVSRSGEVQLDTATVGTAWVITLTDGTNIVDKVTVIVKGDISVGGKNPGDGKITLSDFAAIKAEILEDPSRRLTGVFVLAGDYNDDTKLSLADFALIKKYILTHN